MTKLPRLPLTVDRAGVAGHLMFTRDRQAYCDLAANCQQRFYDIAREQHVLKNYHLHPRNYPAGRLTPSPDFRFGYTERSPLFAEA